VTAEGSFALRPFRGEISWGGDASLEGGGDICGQIDWILNNEGGLQGEASLRQPLVMHPKAILSREETEMNFLAISGFDVLPGKSREFQEWVRTNSAALSENAPEGITLVGVYASTFSSEKHSGHYKTVWRLDSYGAMDRFAAAVGENPELARLLDEFGSFEDVRLGANSSNELLKSVEDITIWADYPEEEQ
jgi:hypothetical protein